MQPEELLELVAPFAGAWIEINELTAEKRKEYVAPFAGAWIEISWCRVPELSRWKSLPSRERGLK